MNNFTQKTLLVQLELLLSNNPYFILIPPKQSGDFDWSVPNVMAGFCLGKIKYLIPDERLLSQRNLIDRHRMEVKSNSDMLSYLDRMHYNRQEAQLRFLPDKNYQEMVNHAKQLMGTKVGADIVGWFAGLISESRCKSRDITIVEKNGEIGFYTYAR